MSWRCHPQRQLSGCPTSPPSMARLCRSPTPPGREARGNCDRGGWKSPARAAPSLQECQQCGELLAAGLECPAPHAACSTHFRGVAISPLPRTDFSQSRAGGSRVLSVRPSVHLSLSRQTVPVKGRVWPHSPSSGSRANYPGLVSIPLPAHASSLERRGRPSDTEITTGAGKCRQTKCLGGLEEFWELLCPAEEAAVGCSWDEQCWAPEGDPHKPLWHYCEALALLWGEQSSPRTGHSLSWWLRTGHCAPSQWRLWPRQVRAAGEESIRVN